MKNWHIGNLGIGHVPRVVGTTVVRSTLADLAAGIRKPDCDFIELRLDLMNPTDDSWGLDVGTLQRGNTPVLATLRAEFEGGNCPGDAERLEALQQAQRLCACIDIESRSALCAPLCAAAVTAGKPIIVSYHDFEATPEATRLHDIIHDMCQYPNAIPKVAVMINKIEDLAVLEEVTATDLGRPKCLIGMGPLGISSRTGLTTRGSALAYGYLDSPAAPGQIACAEMVQHFKSVSPQYARETSA